MKTLTGSAGSVLSGRTKRRLAGLGIAVVLPLAHACGPVDQATHQPGSSSLPNSPDEVPAQALPLVPGLDVHRSLIVTDTVILEPAFSFKRVMDQIVSLSRGRKTALGLFNQWWDTQNPGPGAGPHCDDEKTGGVPSHNGFPWLCPRAEGAQTKTDPFGPPSDPDGYTAIALTNRFDLAPKDGAHCGEYRIIFAKNSGQGSLTARNLVIFEAVLPNPRPSCGLEACRPVAEFWARLSDVADAKERTALLEQLYFKGLPGFRPVIHPDHYGARLVGAGYAASGQVRSNEFMQSPWMLREWRLVNDCRCGRCAMVMVPTTVKVNPFGDLFNEVSAEPRADRFQDAFVGQVQSLAAPDINAFSHAVDDVYNAGQSLSQGNENRYFTHFDLGRMSDPAFHRAVTDRLAAIGSPLTSDDVVHRATALSCAGCHQLSNNQNLGGGLVWPPSATFVHVVENGGPTDPGPDGPRWRISPALSNVFLPFRKQVLEKFLLNRGPICVGPAPAAAPSIEGQPGFVNEPLAVTCRGDEPARPVTAAEVATVEAGKPPTAPTLSGRTVH
jgi:hypothetical protein